DSPFNLVAYSDSDYAGASLNRKFTTKGCQFLGCRLIAWQCKKQTVVATSSTDAEYVAAASCCVQVLWIQNQLLDYGFEMHSLNCVFLGFGLTIQYLQCIDYNLWEIIENDNASIVTKLVDGKETIIPPTTIEEKAQRRAELKARRTLHINFLENQPNVAGSGPTWLFDIDTLTQSMNYQLVNTDADAAFDVKANESEVHVSPSSSVKPNKHDEKATREAKGKITTVGPNSTNSTNNFNAASTPITAVGPNSTNNTNSFSAAGLSSNAVSPNFEIGEKSSVVYPSQYPDDPNMPALEDIIYSDDEEDVEEPKRVYQALKDPSWIEAMQKELLQFKMQKVWGHTLEEGIDYEEVFALVTRIEAIRLFLAYASFMGFIVYQMDVKSTFIYETIDEEVYIFQPPGFEDPDYPDKVYKVVKALYGLHQTPRAWYETLATYLLENGFQRGKIDQTLFIKKQKGDILLVHVYLDDIIFGSTNKELCKYFKKLMKDKFQMSSMGELTFFLGLQVKQKDNGIFISQDKYVDRILRKFGLTDGKSTSTPIDTDKPLLKDPDDASEGFDQIFNFLNAHMIQYALMVNPTIYVLCIKKFWTSVSIKKSNDVMRLQALIDRKKVIITEDTIR
nr:putative ribonuclease H-like domain-containing protein [Tanacetum cinerariifolium]